jgi:sugar/nucleoside kinase (ribokinase family)
MLEAPTVLGYRRWKQIDDEHFLPAVTASLDHLHRKGLLDLEPSPELTRTLLAISNALLTLITQDNDPATARHKIIPIWERLLGSLRAPD